MQNKNRSTISNQPKFPGHPGPGLGRRFVHRGVEKAKDSKKTLKRLWGYLKQQKSGLAIASVLVVAETFLALAGPYLIGESIDVYIFKKDIEGLKSIAWILTGVYVLLSILKWLHSCIMVSVSQKTVMNIRKDLFENIQALPLKAFDTKHKGELMSRLTNDVENISEILNQGVSQIVSSFLTITGAVIIMFVINWQLACISVLTVPMIMFFVKNISKFTKKYFSDQQKNLGMINSMIEESIAGQRVIKAYVREDETVDKFVQLNNLLKESSIKASVYSGMMGPLMNLTNNFRFAIVVSAGAGLTLMKIATVGTIASFIQYARQFGRPLNHMAQLYNSIQAAIAGAERVFEIMDEDSEYKEEKDSLNIFRIDGEVKFENVHFMYKEDLPVLKNLSFHVKPGQTIALVGPTGAGKTTIINLVTRFYEINGGSIKIDGTDIRKIKKDDLRKRMGVVLQDTYLFSGTVRENIRFGRLDATDEEVESAAKLANAHQFIEKLPDGYDTILSEEGGNLSQGQRQLLSISRAVLAKHEILILDEATSSVDTRTEKHIQEALLKLMEGKTSFIIAHRLSTIKEADMIFVIENGEIKERGSHSELLDKKGFYYNLYTSQFKKTLNNTEVLISS